VRESRLIRDNLIPRRRQQRTFRRQADGYTFFPGLPGRARGVSTQIRRPPCSDGYSISHHIFQSHIPNIRNTSPIDTEPQQGKTLKHYLATSCHTIALRLSLSHQQDPFGLLRPPKLNQTRAWLNPYRPVTQPFASRHIGLIFASESPQQIILYFVQDAFTLKESSLL
jgi:hypothetical protein